MNTTTQLILACLAVPAPRLALLELHAALRALFPAYTVKELHKRVRTARSLFDTTMQADGSINACFQWLSSLNHIFLDVCINIMMVSINVEQ